MSKILMSLATAALMFVLTAPIDAAKGSSGGHAGSAKSHAGSSGGSSRGRGGSGSTKGNGSSKTGSGTNTSFAKGNGAGGGTKGKGTGNNGYTGSSKGNGNGHDGRGREGYGNRGTRFEHGIYYRGRDHYHWGAVRFDSRYGCDCYWDPYIRSWYYWCEPDFCFYPVSYCPYRCYTCDTPGAVPTATSEPVPALANPIINNNNSVQVNTPPAIPANPVNEVPPIPQPMGYAR